MSETKPRSRADVLQEQISSLTTRLDRIEGRVDHHTVQITSLAERSTPAPQPSTHATHAGLTPEYARPLSHPAARPRHKSSPMGVLKILGIIVFLFFAILLIAGGLSDMARQSDFNSRYYGSPPGPSQRP